MTINELEDALHQAKEEILRDLEDTSREVAEKKIAAHNKRVDSADLASGQSLKIDSAAAVHLRRNGLIDRHTS